MQDVHDLLENKFKENNGSNANQGNLTLPRYTNKYLKNFVLIEFDMLNVSV
jgi:hypothetical protein